MYIPSHFRQPDREAAIAFMKQYPFAVIVSNGAEAPVTTHLPFHVSIEGEELVLTAHFAKANPQWKSLEEALIIFSGPHAYISPGLYDRNENVPTWNYIAVHAYGNVEIINDETAGFAILEEMMQQSEQEFLAQWAALPEKYKMGLFKGIVPFRVRVNRLEATEKLSQNKTAHERNNIIHALSHVEDSAARDISKFMASREVL